MTKAMRVKTGYVINQPAAFAERRERKAIAKKLFEIWSRDGRPRDGLPYEWSIEPLRPALDRGSQPIGSPRHRDDYDALDELRWLDQRPLTNKEENARGRIGASRLHREPVSPAVVLLLILSAVLCCAAAVGGVRGVLMVVGYAVAIFGVGCFLGRFIGEHAP